MGQILLVNAGTADTSAPTAITDGKDLGDSAYHADSLLFHCGMRGNAAATNTFKVRLWGLFPKLTKATGSVTCSAQTNYSNSDVMATIHSRADDASGVISFLADVSLGGTDTATTKYVDLSGATTAADVGAALETVMLAELGGRFTISETSGVVSLVNDATLGTPGNYTITSDTITSHSVSGFADAVDWVWTPLGNGSDPTAWGYLNGGDAIAEYDASSNKIAFAEARSLFRLMKRVYAQITDSTLGAGNSIDITAQAITESL